jgi:hypothetical protein
VTDQGSVSITYSPQASGPRIYHCRVCGRFSRWINPYPPIPRRR